MTCRKTKLDPKSKAGKTRGNSQERLEQGTEGELAMIDRKTNTSEGKDKNGKVGIHTNNGWSFCRGTGPPKARQGSFRQKTME